MESLNMYYFIFSLLCKELFQKIKPIKDGCSGTEYARNQGQRSLLEGCDSYNYKNKEANREHMKENLSALVTDQKKAPVVGKGEDNGQGVITCKTGRTIEID